jgi:Uncharacterized protein conserved in bacteria (DUF2062)
MSPERNSLLKAAWSKVRSTVRNQLKRGLSPQAAAFAVALGFWIGVIPVLGTTVALCLLTGWLLRLNHAALLAANLLVYPLQLTLLVPFLDLGARAFGEGALGLDLEGLLTRVRFAPWAAVREYGWMEVHACVVWAGLGLLVVPVLILVFTRLFTRIASGLPSAGSQVSQKP